MRVLVNGLSANHPSGKHVLYGHLQQLAVWTRDSHSFVVIAPASAMGEIPDLGSNVTTIYAPCAVRMVSKRVLWEHFEIPKIIRTNSIQLYFTPAGDSLARCPVPQVSLAQNPWCMETTVPKSLKQKFVAFAQRRAYLKAQTSVDMMAYNSRYMHELYHKLCRKLARQSVIVYQGIDDSTHDAALQYRNEGQRSKTIILAVSVMASWKGVDQLVLALDALLKSGIDASLRLVGPWPDAQYESRVRKLVEEKRLLTKVTITGKVPRAQLYHEMANARVFALPSRCESFGIPAVESQAFGTPVIGSSTTAMSEVCGTGGEYCEPADLIGLTNSLTRLLTDDGYWDKLSNAARSNAAKYRWEQCSKPLMQMFDLA